jgi:hypothetical protein
LSDGYALDQAAGTCSSGGRCGGCGRQRQVPTAALQQ